MLRLTIKSFVPQCYQNQHDYQQSKEKYAKEQYSSFDSFLFILSAIMIFIKFRLFCIFCKNSVVLRMKHIGKCLHYLLA